MDLLFKKIYGCEACGTIGNAMGDIMEGVHYLEKEKKWGFVDTFLPQSFEESERENVYGGLSELGPRWFKHAHTRAPGVTEDGEERHRLCVNAIIKKGGRIDVMDLARTWAEDIKPENFGYLLGPQDQVIYYAIKTGMPPWEIGRYAVWPAMIGTAKMVLPVGEINACNPERAAVDALNLARLKDMAGVPGNYALEVAQGLAAAVAEAMKPDASVGSIIDTALGYLSAEPRAEVEMGLDWAAKVDNWKDIAPLYEDYYNTRRISNAVEVMSGALACLYLAGGDPKNTILYAINTGRDTDCKAHISGTLAGALKGIDHVPMDWVETVDKATFTHDYSVAKRTIRESAEGIYKAALNVMNETRQVTDTLAGMLQQ